MILHKSATSSHYNKEAKHYDAFNEKNSLGINAYLEALFVKHKIKSILDLTCGTGSQVLHLINCGFDVVGYDINAKMLHIAKENAKKKKIPAKFFKGDMRITHAGEFDAVITIFNAIGHLTKQDFEKAIKNIYTNLKPSGLYVFDIFNLSYLLFDDTITTLTIDRQIKSGDTVAREIQYSTISEDGVLASYDIYHEQKGASKPKITKAFQTLQVYTKEELKQILERNGFTLIKCTDVEGGRFHKNKTERMLIVAKKVK